MDWFREEMGKRFEYQHRGRIGTGNVDGKEMGILNGIATWNKEGAGHEGHQRHLELSMNELGLIEEPREVRVPMARQEKERRKRRFR